MPPKPRGGEGGSSTISRPRTSAKSKRTWECKFYRQGKCRYGAKCAFLHSSETPGSTSTVMDSNNTEKAQQPVTVQAAGLQVETIDAKPATGSGGQGISGHPSAPSPSKRTRKPRTRRGRGGRKVTNDCSANQSTSLTETQDALSSKAPNPPAKSVELPRAADVCVEEPEPVQAPSETQGESGGDTLFRNACDDLRRPPERRERQVEEHRQRVTEESFRKEVGKDEERGQQEGYRRLQEEELMLREEGRRRREQERRRLEEERRKWVEGRQRQEEERLLREEERRRLEEAQQREKERQEREKAERQAQILEAIERRRREVEEERQRRALEARKAEIRRREKRKRQAEIRVTRQLIVQGSNLVTFGAGLEVIAIIPGFDLCSLTIRNLPADAPDFEITRLFHEHGMDDTQFQLISCKIESNNTQTAQVFLHAEKARLIATELDGHEFHNTGRFIKLEVGENASSGSMKSSTRGDKMRTLTVTWEIPSLTMVASYCTAAEARAQLNQLNGKVVNNRKIIATLMNVPDETRWRRTPWLRSLASIELENVDPYMEPLEMTLIAKASDVQTTESSNYDLTSFLSWLERTLAKEGSIVGSYETTKIDDRRMRAMAKFNSRHALEKAAAILIARQNPPLQVFIPSSEHQYSIKIPDKQYRAQKAQWDAMTENRTRSRGRNAYVRITEQRKNGEVSIELHGSDEQEIGALKVRVEGLVAGERLDAEYWHHSFCLSEEALREGVSAETGAFLSVDSRFLALRVFGGSNQVAAAKEYIRREVRQLGLVEYAIPIPCRSVRFFVATGLRILKEALGEENVTLDVAAGGCRLKLKGGDDTIKHAQKLIEEALTAATDTVIIPSNENSDDGVFCPICRDTPSHPKILSCGHSCCEPCLRHYVTSAGTSRHFPLVCLGDEATCNTPISIPIIEGYLTKQRFDDLINVGFASHIQSNPQKLKYCPTPDCIQIYECNLGKQFDKCPSCFAGICLLCNEKAHQGMTCEERRIHSNPAEQERLTEEWARSNNVKRCPSCDILTEKTEGCNHMTCRCGIHWCWICQGVFNEQNIYRHMREAHGGIRGGVHGNNIQQARNRQRLHQRDQQQQREQQLLEAELQRQIEEEVILLQHYEEQQRHRQDLLHREQAQLRRTRTRHELREVVNEGGLIEERRHEDERRRYNEAYERDREQRREREAQIITEVLRREDRVCKIM